MSCSGLEPTCPWDDETWRVISSTAAEHGQLEVLQWLRGQDPPCPWDESTCTTAARYGRLEILQWLRAQHSPYPWDYWTCSAAAGGGHLDILQCLRAQDPLCPWAAETCSKAAAEDLETLQWLRAQDPPVHGQHRLAPMQYNMVNCTLCSGSEVKTPLVHGMIISSAASYGHLETLQRLRAQDPLVHGQQRPAPKQLNGVTWKFCNGSEVKIHHVHGMSPLADQQFAVSN